ncbi:hypothetical protein BOO91_16855 [Vibrio navarrensis]|uniref:DUF2861 family protein n=1 Tax=Vibrio navarrensis TaxID=29495 RepID=A0AAJ4LW99_9VIBR|nr:MULTISPECIES: DUF2861 family protein [Vibrio]KJR28937.1 hypothetical protein UF06_13535 [Vibrio sp. S234-5]MBE3658265.1 hypothetical protein [Vibrio navarrensis]MBE3662609.1 hypothetical protein [Vibrio navarrensis]MBE4602586.1 hypothetical protein [Vibrio navarrensis]QPL55897.1 DUF2861 family protein [Vibrio navarrensis]
MRSLVLTSFVASLFVQPVYGVDWFEKNTPLTQAHKHLLEDDLSGMFDSFVEVWQSSPNDTLKSHLNELLILSLERDCGKSLTKKKLPVWVSGVNIIRQTIQSPGRDTHRLVIDVRSTRSLSNVSITRWIDRSVSADSLFNEVSGDGVTIRENEKRYQKRYNLSGKLESGLYRLLIEAEDGSDWSGWIILGEPTAPQYVRWASKENWKVEKRALMNPYCPLPEMNVGLYDFVNGQYERVWNKTYESDYPESLELEGIPNERYVLAVSLNTKRWQGDIIVEQSQTISRTYDITQE